MPTTQAPPKEAPARVGPFNCTAAQAAALLALADAQIAKAQEAEEAEEAEEGEGKADG